jgi:hypothetical protein
MVTPVLNHIICTKKGILKRKKEHCPILVGEKDSTAIKNMKSAIEFPHTPTGRAFLVKSLFQGELEAVKGKVIDHMGVAACVIMVKGCSTPFSSLKIEVYRDMIKEKGALSWKFC